MWSKNKQIKQFWPRSISSKIIQFTLVDIAYSPPLQQVQVQNEDRKVERFIQLWFSSHSHPLLPLHTKSYFPRMKFYGLCQLNSIALEFNTIFRNELTENCSSRVLLTHTKHHRRHEDRNSYVRTKQFLSVPSIPNNFLLPSIRTPKGGRGEANWCLRTFILLCFVFSTFTPQLHGAHRFFFALPCLSLFIDR